MRRKRLSVKTQIWLEKAETVDPNALPIVMSKLPVLKTKNIRLKIKYAKIRNRKIGRKDDMTTGR